MRDVKSPCTQVFGATYILFRLVFRLVLYHLYTVLFGVVVRAVAYRSEHPGFESP